MASSAARSVCPAFTLVVLKCLPPQTASHCKIGGTWALDSTSAQCMCFFPQAFRCFGRKTPVILKRWKEDLAKVPPGHTYKQPQAKIKITKRRCGKREMERSAGGATAVNPSLTVNHGYHQAPVALAKIYGPDSEPGPPKTANR